MVHHFAHEDRRECRHALEASIFGMTIKLISESHARLCLPPFGDRQALASQVGAMFTRRQERKFFASRWVVDGEIIPVTNPVVHVSQIDDSTPDSPDISLPDRRIEIHLISHKKTPQALLEHARSAPASVLCIDLRKYAAMWWNICDEDKDGVRKVVSQAIDLLRDWLANKEAGRGWLANAEFDKRRQTLIDWAAEQKKREKQQREAERLSRKQESEPAQKEETGDPIQVPAMLDPSARAEMDCWPPQIHGRPAGIREFGMIKEEEATEPPQEDVPDKVVRENVGICPVCRASQNEVVLGSGPFRGRNAVCCSRHPRHPMTMLATD
jgi:hypothetical protein